MPLLLYVIHALGGVAVAGGGGLDSAFGVDGLAPTIDSHEPNSLAIQPDGKILVGGEFNVSFVSRLAVARHMPNGSFDPSFGSDGVAEATLAPDRKVCWGGAIAAQADGAVVVAGSSQRSSQSGCFSADMTVVRFGKDGSLDTTFAGRGWATTNFPGYDTAVPIAVAVQHDGKIMVAGRAHRPPFSGRSSDVVLARFLTDGSPDPSFGASGIVMTDSGDEANDSATDAVLQPDGKLLVSVCSRPSDANPDASNRLMVMRYNANGTLDGGFATGGKLIITSPSDAVGGCSIAGPGTDLALQGDGRIVVAANATRSNDSVTLRRYHASGTPDTSFEPPALDDPLDIFLTVDSQNRVLYGDLRIFFSEPDSDIVVARLHRFSTTGEVDLSFGDDGVVTLPTNWRLRDLAVAHDGGIIVLGGNQPIALARISAEPEACRLVDGWLVGGSPGGWAFRAEVSADDGLVVRDLRFGSRLVARQLSIPYVHVSWTGGGGGARFAELSPTPKSTRIKSRLLSTRCLATAGGSNSMGVEATYRLFVGSESDPEMSVLVHQDYRFVRAMEEHCEPTHSVPCVRFWPTVTWGDELGNDFVAVSTVQRFEFDPDGSGKGASQLISDELARINPGYGVDVLGQKGRLKREDSRVAIEDGQRNYWDNWHQTGRERVHGPGIVPLIGGPGCSECVHMHWSWGCNANAACSACEPVLEGDPVFGCCSHRCWTDGHPQLREGSRQSAVVGWVKYKEHEVDPVPSEDAPHAQNEGWWLLKEPEESIGISDRAVLYWEAVSNTDDSTGVTIGNRIYSGDSFWPQLPDTGPHGGNGSIFVVPARLISPSAGDNARPWTITPEWGSIVHHSMALGDGLPSGWMLPVKVAAPSKQKRFPYGTQGPFALRVKSTTATLLNPDELYMRTPLGVPWYTIRSDVYRESTRRRAAEFVRGKVVRDAHAGDVFVTYLVFDQPPSAGDVQFTLVASPDGHEGYQPAPIE